MAKVAFVSLGCPKNLVDSEYALGEIVGAGHELVIDKSHADAIVVNTCGFIESARMESREAIEDALWHKENGQCKAVVVVGCLSQRSGRAMAEEMPEVDVFMGVEHAGKLGPALAEALSGVCVLDESQPSKEIVESEMRVLSTPPWTAYLKVSDGCDNRCSYCAIPDIRGPYRSKIQPRIVSEATALMEQGVKELILIGQDLTRYGYNLPSISTLASLTSKLSRLEDIHWIRLMYCYPTRVTDDLIDTVASTGKVVKYLDIPLQHGDDRILRDMNRLGNVDDYMRLVDRIRSKCPEIALRSSFIVGFPGEDDVAFNNLMKFVEKIQFDRVGVFAYSREDGTPAAALDNQVDEDTKALRVDALMQLQQGISLRKNRSFVGQTLEVLVEGRSEDGVWGRSYRDAPEIDGVVCVNGSRAKPGEFIEARITGASEYDLESVSK